MVTLLTFLGSGLGEGDDFGDGITDGLGLSSQNVNISETNGQGEHEGQGVGVGVGVGVGIEEAQTPLELQVFPEVHVPQDPPHPSVPQALPVQLGVQENEALMVCVPVTPVKVNEEMAPLEEPSTKTSFIDQLALGLIANVWSEPSFTLMSPNGFTDPPSPAVEVMVWVFILYINEADMTWSAVILLKVYVYGEEVGFIGEPLSTITELIE